MDLTGILSVAGHGGLFKLIKQSKNGFIVESIIDQKRMQAFASSKISTLEDIAIYTETGEIHLKEVFRKIFTLEDGKQIKLDSKDSNEKFKNFLEKVLPDYDKERVYVSDIKKLVNWYNLLNEKGMIDLVEDKPEDSNVEKTEETEIVKEKKSKHTPAEKVETSPVKKPVKKTKKEDKK
jgi:hypothetical protein